MTKFKQLLASSALAVGVGIGASAGAAALFGVEFSGPTPLYSVNQTNGSIAAIGPTGFDNVGDLTSDTRAGSARMWGIRIASNQLLSIDPGTGAAVVAANLNSTDPITSIAFDPVGGKLYGNTTVGFGAAFDALYEIDPLTGNTTFIGRILFEDVFALGFDQSGRLFGVADTTDQLIEISLATGNGALIAGLQLGLVFDIASRPEDDVMFLADSGTSSLYTLDTANGNVTLVGPYGSPTNVVGLAFAAVPEPGSLLLLAAGAFGLAFVRRRR